MRYIIAVAALLLGSGAVQAQKPGNWQFVAVKTVGSATDTDIAYVSTKREFRQLRLCVKRAPINLDGFSVVYGNGKREEIELRNRFKDGTCSRAIDLKGAKARHIKQIVMRYERLRSNGRTPIVTVTGR